MANDDECIHGLGPIAACTICNGREKQQRLDRRKVDYQWTARFGGVCACCRDDFIVGELIGRNANDEYICSTCAVVAP